MGSCDGRCFLLWAMAVCLPLLSILFLTNNGRKRFSDLKRATTEATGDEFGEVLDPLENAGGSQKKRRNTKSKAITLSDLEPLFVLPLDIAAKRLGVGRTTFRTRCRELGIRKWPYKKRNVNTVRNQQREIKLDIDTCPETDVGRTAFRKRRGKKRNVNTVVVCDQPHDIDLFPMDDIDTCPEMLREMQFFLMDDDIDTCPEMLRQMEPFLKDDTCPEMLPMDIYTCPEMLRQMEPFLKDDTCPADGNQPALEKKMQEFKALI